MDNSRFITWARWFESKTYDIVENIYDTHSEYLILRFEGYCVAKNKYLIPTKEEFVELLDYINNEIFKNGIDRDKATSYIKEFIKIKKLKEIKVSC